MAGSSQEDSLTTHLTTVGTLPVLPIVIRWIFIYRHRHLFIVKQIPLYPSLKCL